MKEIGSLQQSADSTFTPVTVSHCNNRPNHEALRLKCKKFYIKIYVNDLSMCDFKLIH
jgi:hypothetical protein